MAGKFIVFEGMDNTGKSTISKLTSYWLESQNIPCVLTQHPGSTPVGQELRRILKHSKEELGANAQALLFAADNSLFMEHILKPNLDQNKWVISDRNNFISSLAYQIASGCSLEELDKVHDATKQTAQIDLLFILKCSWEEISRRKKVREKFEGKPEYDRFEDAPQEYINTLLKCYDQIANDHQRLSKFLTNPSNVIIVDVEQDIGQVMDCIQDSIRSIFPQQLQ